MVGAIVFLPTDAASQEAVVGSAQRVVVARARAPRDVAVQHCLECLGSEHPDFELEGSARSVLQFEGVHLEAAACVAYAPIDLDGQVGIVVDVPTNSSVWLYVCMVIMYSSVWIDRVRLPILLVVSRTEKTDISLTPFALENLISRDGLGSPVPRQPARLHTQAESGAYLWDSSRVPRRRTPGRLPLR